jgi:hypothetical protein
MDMSMFLAQVWGPILLAFAVGLFTSKAHYSRVYSDIQKEPLALLTFGMFAMALGIAQLSIHNAWDTPLQIIVSLLSWGVLLKGTMFIVAPNWVDHMGDWQSKSGLVTFAGVGALLLGGYMTWVAYLV